MQRDKHYLIYIFIKYDHSTHLVLFHTMESGFYLTSVMCELVIDVLSYTEETAFLMILN